MKRTQLSLSLVVFLGVLGYTPIAALAQVPQVKGVKPGVIAAIQLNQVVSVLTWLNGRLTLLGMSAAE